VILKKSLFYERQNTKTILVVEDDEALGRDIIEMLAFEGFDVIGASDVKKGVELARQHRPDLILCDIMMPEMDGYGVLHHVRSDPALVATLFVFLTARSERSDVRIGMEAGADDYLTKPFTAHEVIGALLTAFRKRELLRDAIRNQKDTHAFLSYSRKDIPIMERVRDTLTEAGLKVWTDYELEPGTSDWEQAVVSAMKYTGSCVVILSPDAEQSKWVGREIALAEILGVRIFPILARGDERTSIPFRLMTSQWLDARHNYQEALYRLISAIHKHLDLK
jgi:DNA-binding response OmpR family regulator